MADYIKDTAIRVTISDQTQAGAAKVEQSTRKLANSVGTFVSDKAGKAMSQFNEKTEKGRQLINAFGTAVGGASGQLSGFAANAVYYSGTIGYVIGRFSAWELAIMGTIAAVGALTVAIFSESEAEKQWREHIEKETKATEKLNEELRKLAQQKKETAYGISKSAKLTSEAANKLFVATARVEEYKRKYNEAVRAAQGRTWTAPVIEAKKRLDAAFRLQDQAQTLLDQAKKQQEKLRQLELANKQVETITPEGEGKPKAEGARKPNTRAQDIAQEMAGYQMMNDAIKGFELFQAQQEKKKQLLLQSIDEQAAINQAKIDLEQQMEDKNYQIFEYYAQKRNEQLQYEQDMRKTIWQTGIQGAEAMGQMAVAMIKNEKVRLRVQATFEALMAGIKAARENAEAEAALASKDYAGAALHYKAMASYIMTAALAGARAAGFGGGGSAGGGGYSGFSSSGPDLGQQQEGGGRSTTIIIQGHLLTGSNAGDTIRQLISASEDQENPGRDRTEVDI